MRGENRAADRPSRKRGEIPEQVERRCALEVLQLGDDGDSVEQRMSVGRGFGHLARADKGKSMGTGGR
jgi:hypothetical protein